jgi:para-nitrobenzyl esterase
MNLLKPARPLLSRREFLTNAGVAALALQTRNLRALTNPGLANPLPATTPAAIVRTPSGILRGEAADGFSVFRGVPFAEPPTGNLRFRPPIPIKPWTGEYDATHFGAAPYQWHDQSRFNDVLIKHSEDCLYLNIWAPEGKGPFPVFVWIHGGGYVAGHAFESIFYGNEFAKQGIVCVSVAYRLGVFGFLDVGPLLGAEYNGSANNALRDLIVSLEWVQKNISAFGGDPGQVTIGGESAGAKLTDTLMGVPSAEHLFHQMISESGGAERVWAESDARLVGTAYGRAWVAQSGSTGQSAYTLPGLKTADPDTLIDLQHKFMADYPYHFPLRCEVDGKTLPRLPVQTVSAGSSKGKRLLIGTNRDESALFIGAHPTSDPTAKDLGNLPVTAFSQVLEKYKDIYPQMPDFQRRIRAVTAEEYWVPSTRILDAHIHGGGTAFMYRLDFVETSGRLTGFAYHAIDLPLVWEKPHDYAGNVDVELALAKQVHLAWVAFIQGKTPAAPGLPPWPEYSLDNRATMILDTKSRVESSPNEAELRLWQGVL